MDPNILKRVYQKSDEIVHRRIAEETILVPLRGKLVDMQKIFSLNPVADYIWEHLDGKQDLMAICSQIDALFDSKPEEVQTDVVDFINELLEANLIAEVED
jgi:hypothetical protein